MDKLKEVLQLPIMSQSRKRTQLKPREQKLCCKRQAANAEMYRKVSAAKHAASSVTYLTPAEYWDLTLPYDRLAEIRCTIDEDSSDLTVPVVNPVAYLN